MSRVVILAIAGGLFCLATLPYSAAKGTQESQVDTRIARPTFLRTSLTIEMSLASVGLTMSEGLPELSPKSKTLTYEQANQFLGLFFQQIKPEAVFVIDGEKAENKSAEALIKRLQAWAPEGGFQLFVIPPGTGSKVGPDYDLAKIIDHFLAHGEFRLIEHE